jgi:hypothetical protein
MSFYFLTEFFKYFFRVLHAASSSWLKLFRVFQLHPVYFNWKTDVNYDAKIENDIVRPTNLL